MSERWTDTVGTVHTTNPECHNSGCQYMALIHDMRKLEREREADRAAVSYLDKVLAVYHKHAGCGFTYPLGPVPECAACTAATIHAAALQRAQDAKG